MIWDVSQPTEVGRVQNFTAQPKPTTRSMGKMLYLQSTVTAAWIPLEWALSKCILIAYSMTEYEQVTAPAAEHRLQVRKQDRYNS